MAGHANVRVALDMYVDATAGILDRARTANRIARPAATKGSGRFTQAVMRPDPSSCLRGTTCLMQNLGEPDIAPLLVSAEAAEFDDTAARRAVRHS